MGMSIEELQRVFESVYEDKPMGDVLSFGFHPEASSARGANICRLAGRIAVHRALGGTTVAVFLVIDLLVKGAGGLAVQTMNVIFGFAESEGLWQLPVLP